MTTNKYDKYENLLILMQKENSDVDEYNIQVKYNNLNDYTNAEMKGNRIICCLPFFSKSGSLLKHVCEKMDQKFIKGHTPMSFKGKELFMKEIFIESFNDFGKSPKDEKSMDRTCTIPPSPFPSSPFPSSPFPYSPYPSTLPPNYPPGVKQFRKQTQPKIIMRKNDIMMKK